MNRILGNLKQSINNIVKKGFLYIVFSSFFNKIGMLLASILIVRLMDKTQYGVFTYAYNIVSIVTIVSSIGIDNALMQMCSEKRDASDKQAIKKFCLTIGLCTNLFFSFGIIIVSSIVQLKIPEGRVPLQLLAFLLPLQYVLTYCKTLLRIDLDNKKYSILTNVATFSYVIISVGLVIPWGIWGAVFGRYFGYVIPIILGLVYVFSDLRKILKTKMPSKDISKMVFSYGFVVALTNGVSELLYYLDVYVVGLVTSDSNSIATYKAATIVPNGLAALPVAIMIFVYPYFARNKDNLKWIKSNLIKMQACMFPVGIIVSGILMFIAPYAIRLFYGSHYDEAILPFRILLIGFVFSCAFRVVSGYVIAMLGKVKINLVLGCIECSLNILFDYFLIKTYGSVGAAIATTSIMIISSIMSTVYLYCYLLKNMKHRGEV